MISSVEAYMENLLMVTPKKCGRLMTTKKLIIFHGLQSVAKKEGKREALRMKQYLHILMQLMDMMITSQYQHKMQKFY